MKAILYMPLILALSGGAAGRESYEKPMPHSSGETILEFCEDTDDVISQLRCNYYVQGVADLVVQTPLACLPKGMTQSELIEVATAHLETVDKSELGNSSGAGLLLSHLQRSYRCPTKPGGIASDDQKTDKQRYFEAIGRAIAEQQAAEANAPVEKPATGTTGSAKENTEGEH